ncbi:MAG TPA: ATP-binding protein [Candidatus Angelobacter sp.]|nr:ATP-binding protein [Candidatus Angelobacter sp.]
MATNLYMLQLRNERDVVQARQRTRDIASMLGFENRDQIGLATAVSEMARNAFRYARHGKVVFDLQVERPQALEITISDSGPGIPNLDAVLEGRYKSETGLGIGIIGTKRLMDGFDLQTAASGTVVKMRKGLPATVPFVSAHKLREMILKIKAREPESPYEEIERQNQELLKTLEELRKRQEELAFLNRELEDTNRGVVALYAELDDRADYLRRASELKTAFFSNISHEFKTPLNSIISLSRMLLEHIDGDLTTEQEKQVQYIAEASGLLSDMVSDLLDLAKVEAGKVNVRVKNFRVDELFSALKGMLKPLLADNSSVDLVFEDNTESAKLRTDDGKVSQILRNFISNAIKFTPQGEIRVYASMVGENVRFEVRDTGIGIAPEHHETIFEEFTQVENPLQGKFRGTGLGLPLCRNLSALLGGRVWVESELGRGSRFFSEIPAVYRGEAETPGELQAREFNRAPVLLIDDSVDAFTTIEPYFRDSEFQLVQMNTLERAQRWLQLHVPVAIVANLYLQGSSIGGFLRAYKRNFQNGAKIPPVIAVSAYDDASVAALNGGDIFFKKPYNPHILLREVRRLTENDQPKKVLLVDDNDVSRYILRQLLDQPWLTLSEARNGEECLKAVSDERPDAIILDLNMPGMDGMEVLERLRSREETSALPVVIYTSKTLSQNERTQIEQLHAAFLSKNDVATTLSPEKVLNTLAAVGISQLEKP